MTRFFSSLILLLLPLALCASELTDRLAKIKSITSVTELQSEIFAEKYSVSFSQPLDYSNPKAGSFNHRVVIMHRGFDRPTVMVTEGYEAAYALSPKYDEEIARHLNANIVFVEHRYFLESTPELRNWDYLTVENAMNDLHDIRTLLAPIYDKKWLATGISKGGSTTMYYRAYFPDDVDASVPYVGPMNTGVQDGRHEIFLRQSAGTPAQRAALREFQIALLKRKPALMPLFDSYIAEKGYKFKLESKYIYDYCVLEFPFAYWQWGKSVHKLPSIESDDETLFKFFVEECGPDYFCVPEQNRHLSFFVQAAKELGYYGYDIMPFTQWLDVKSTKNYLAEIFLPKELEDVKYDGTANTKTLNFIKDNDVTMLFVYGECDPWSATGTCDWLDCSQKKNMHMFIDPNGSHLSRIGTMPASMRERAWRIIDDWMK
ncbi:MAG: aminopeptidase [Bacteroidaceae bacterium]|nr:aminopeptidase [Bacteroidaceae bacterium]